jgi:hypothetical protein
MLLASGTVLLSATTLVMRWARPVDGQLSPNLKPATTELVLTAVVSAGLFGSIVLMAMALFGGQ